MKLLSLLITLLIIGFLIQKQLGPSTQPSNYENTAEDGSITPPKITSSVQDVHNLADDMDVFIQDTAEQRAEAMEETLNQ